MFPECLLYTLGTGATVIDKIHTSAVIKWFGFISSLMVCLIEPNALAQSFGHRLNVLVDSAYRTKSLDNLMSR